MKNLFSPLTHPITIGKIGGAYGVLGWMKVISFTDNSGDIFNYSPWFLSYKYEWKIIYLDHWRMLGNRYIIKVKDVTNRETARLFAHNSIVIDRNQLPCLRDNEYYCEDLIGCTVITIQEEFLGYIINIIETTANDVLVIAQTYNQDNNINAKEYLVPFVQDEVIKSVNLDERVIIVDWNIDF